MYLPLSDYFLKPHVLNELAHKGHSVTDVMQEQRFAAGIQSC